MSPQITQIGSRICVICGDKTGEGIVPVGESREADFLGQEAF